MRRELNWVLAAVVLAAACEREATTYKQPPAGSYTTGTRQVKIGDAVTPVEGASVTPDFFSAAGVQPLLGRFFVEGDEARAEKGVIALSHDLWRERFDSSPAVIGREIEVDGRPAVVVGIAPRGFSLPGSTLVWTPMN